jgi:hypothetical protein
LADTRNPGPGPLLSGVTRTLPLHGACGVPATARALALNVTVTSPTAGGHLTLWPADLPQPATSTLNFGGGQTRANNAIVPLATDGAGSLAANALVLAAGSTHLIVDVTGYFE